MTNNDIAGVFDAENRLSVVPLNDLGRRNLILRRAVALGLPTFVAVLIPIIAGSAGAGIAGTAVCVVIALLIVAAAYLLTRPYVRDLADGTTIRYRGNWTETFIAGGQGVNYLLLDLPVQDIRPGHEAPVTRLKVSGQPFERESRRRGKNRVPREEVGHVDFTRSRHLVTEIQYRT